MTVIVCQHLCRENQVHPTFTPSPCQLATPNINSTCPLPLLSPTPFPPFPRSSPVSRSLVGVGGVDLPILQFPFCLFPLGYDCIGAPHSPTLVWSMIARFGHIFLIVSLTTQIQNTHTHTHTHTLAENVQNFYI